MKVARNLVACLVLALVLLTPALTPVMAVVPPLTAGTFPVGTIVVPMDGKQNDRIHVYGLIHEFLRTTPNSMLARVIEPPDVTLQTSLSPGGDVYQGGPFLIASSYNSAITALLGNSTFSKVTVTQLTSSFTSNNIFYVRQATRILVIGDGYWGKTFLTLQRMGISYTQVTTDQILANPSMINQYTLVVLDSPGWYGNGVAAYTPSVRSQIQAVYTTIQTWVQAGNEAMFTDAALLDLNSTFPGYIQLGTTGIASTPTVTIYNPPKGGFNPEFPSQYYNAGPNPNSAVILTEEGAGEWVPTGVQPAHAGDVRIQADSRNYGYPHPQVPYTILAFYFPYGNGIVQGLAFQPYEQYAPPDSQSGYYATYEVYGNKFVEGEQPDFLLSATPSTQSVAQTQTATYTVSIASVEGFSSAVSLQVTGGLPPGAQASFAPTSITPPAGGTISSTLTIPTSLSTPTGTYTLTITGTSSLPPISHSVTVTLTVTTPPSDFGISVSPNPVVVNQGQCGNVTVTATSVGNFSSPIALTLTNLPTHVTGTFKPNPVTPPAGGTAQSSLLLCPDTSLPPGNYTITVDGTSGVLVHTADVTLDVPTPVFNFLLLLILLALLFLSIFIGLLAFAFSKKGGRRTGRVRARYVLPMPTVRCRNCGRMMPLQAIFCPFCGRPQATMVPRPGRVVATKGRTSRSVVGFSLTLVSGILVLLNSAAFLAPSFYGIWSGIFFWLPAIGQNDAFVIGVIIGLTIIMASIVMAMGHGAIADVVIFPFAVFSLIIGGGFVAGFAIGVVGGILGALRR